MSARSLTRFDPRQTMGNKRFEVSHTCDTDLYTIDLHHHDFYEIYYFISGQVEYRVEGSTYLMQPGDLLLISKSDYKLHS